MRNILESNVSLALPIALRVARQPSVSHSGIELALRSELEIPAIVVHKRLLYREQTPSRSSVHPISVLGIDHDTRQSASHYQYVGSG